MKVYAVAPPPIIIAFVDDNEGFVILFLMKEEKS